MADLRRSLSSSPSLSSSSSAPLEPFSVDEELWMMAEERTQEILCTVQPNVVSELSRKEVIIYVQRLIGSYYGTEVYPFGSVPLKTYLPDGDIDLTVVSHQHQEEDMAKELCSILENGDTRELEVKDVQYIPAQVKIVKCTVKGIAVDISFNQMAGLCTLYFLEQVDRTIGENHLFKRSVLLVKAWCYYESRILGAHHGLLSTYALETLVLYIINLFYSSLRGPLDVLYRFLDYYSRFDWDRNCLTINGPLPISSPPEAFDVPESAESNLFLTNDFLKNCRDMFTDPAMASMNTVQCFPLKHLNIVDPLKNNNNLGRSVSIANYHRIRCALSYGVQKLGTILKQPGETMGRALEKFFGNTLDRNGKGLRPDVQVPVPAFGTGRSESPVFSWDYKSYYGGLIYSQWYHNYALPVAYPSPPPSPSQLQDQNACDTAENSVWYDWNFCYPSGADVYFPGQMITYANTSPQATATYAIEEPPRSRGTGTYIPDMTRSYYSDMPSRRLRTKRPDSTFRAPKKMPQMTAAAAEYAGSTLNGNAKKFEISIEDFPVLTRPHKPSTSVPQQSVQLTIKSPKDKDSGPSCLSTEIVTNKLSKLQIEVDKAHAGSGSCVSTSSDALLTSIGMHGDDKTSYGP